MKRRLSRLRALIRDIDGAMKKNRWSAWRRKQLWRDFVKSSEVRKEFVDTITDVNEPKTP